MWLIYHEVFVDGVCLSEIGVEWKFLFVVKSYSVTDLISNDLAERAGVFQCAV